MDIDDIDFDESQPREDQELSDSELWDRYMDIDVNDFIEEYVIDWYEGDLYWIISALEEAPQIEEGLRLKPGRDVYYRLSEYIKKLMSSTQW